MAKFTVVYVKGRAAIRGSNVGFEASPGKSTYEVEANSRATAFIKAYKHLTNLGLEVFLPKVSEGENPLGFSDAEIEAVAEAGIPFQTDIRHGARIEKIVEG